MSKTEDIAQRMVESMDEIDALELEKKAWMEDWKTRMEIARSGLNMWRADVRQMRLGEDQDG